MSNLYNVYYLRPDTKLPSMGIVRSFYKDLASAEEKAVHKRHNLVIDDSITPDCFEMNPARVQEASFDDADKFIQTAHDNARKKAPKTFGVGSIFNLPVADGRAYYIVTKINKTTCEIEWRGFGGGDRYTDNFLGCGGKYDINKIKSFVDRDLAMDKLFARKKKVA